MRLRREKLSVINKQLSSLCNYTYVPRPTSILSKLLYAYDFVRAGTIFISALKASIHVDTNVEIKETYSLYPFLKSVAVNLV